MDLFAIPTPAFSGAKLPLRPMHVWAIRVRLQLEGRDRDLALFDIALDSKLRGCDVVALRLADIVAEVRSAGEPRSCSRRPAALCTLKSRIRRGAPFLAGWRCGRPSKADGFFQAELGWGTISRPANIFDY